MLFSRMVRVCLFHGRHRSGDRVLVQDHQEIESAVRDVQTVHDLAVAQVRLPGPRGDGLVQPGMDAPDLLEGAELDGIVQDRFEGIQPVEGQEPCRVHTCEGRPGRA